MLSKARVLFTSFVFCILFFSNGFSEPIPEYNHPIKNVKDFAIKIALQYVQLVGGDRKTGFDSSLTPVPDRYSGSAIGVEADLGWFLIGSDFLGSYSASGANLNPLKVFNLNIFKAGVNGKINLFSDMNSVNINLFGNAGISYGIFNLEQDYKSLFSASTVWFSGSSSGIGFFGGAGVEIENGGLLFGTGVFIDYLSTKYADAASKPAAMLILRIPIYVGYAF